MEFMKPYSLKCYLLKIFNCDSFLSGNKYFVVLAKADLSDCNKKIIVPLRILDPGNFSMQVQHSTDRVYGS